MKVWNNTSNHSYAGDCDNMKAFVAYVGIATVAWVIFLLFVPFIPASEPFIDFEEYQRSCRYEVTSAAHSDSFDSFRNFLCRWVNVQLENKDTKGGLSYARFYLTSGGTAEEKSVYHYVGEGQTTEFYANWSEPTSQEMNVSHSVTAPMVWDAREVQKTHTVYKPLFQWLSGT